MSKYGQGVDFEGRFFFIEMSSSRYKKTTNSEYKSLLVKHRLRRNSKLWICSKLVLASMRDLLGTDDELTWLPIARRMTALAVNRAVAGISSSIVTANGSKLSANCGVVRD